MFLCVLVEARPGVWYYAHPGSAATPHDWRFAPGATAFGPFNEQDAAITHASRRGLQVSHIVPNREFFFDQAWVDLMFNAHDPLLD